LVEIKEFSNNEMLRKTIVAFFVCMLFVTGVTGIVYAQQNATSDNSTNNQTSVMQIDNQVTLVNYEFNEDTVTITVRASQPAAMKISDMFVRGTGATEIPTKTVTLTKGTSEIEMETTAFNGLRGVVIATTGGTVGITDRSSTQLFTGSYGGGTVFIIGIVGAIVGVSVVLIASYRREFSISSNVEREL
jgi:hypothetical protein